MVIVYKGGRRVPSKNGHFPDFSKNCEKLEKSQNLLKLINSRVGGARGSGRGRVPSKNCDFSTNCEKLEKSRFLLKLINLSGKGGGRVPSKNCDFCNFCDFSKNCCWGWWASKTRGKLHVDLPDVDLSFFKTEKGISVKVTVTAYVDPQHFAVLT